MIVSAERSPPPVEPCAGRIDLAWMREVAGIATDGRQVLRVIIVKQPRQGAVVGNAGSPPHCRSGDVGDSHAASAGAILRLGC